VARGQKCPKCGRLTFQQEGEVWLCSRPACQALGWPKRGPRKSSKRGRKCTACGVYTMKQVGTLNTGQGVHKCFSCSAVYIDNN